MEESIIEGYAKMTDDLFMNLLSMKDQDSGNSFIPFTYAHILELSAKTACFKLGLDNGSGGLNHKIMDIYPLLDAAIPNLKQFLPEEADFDIYKQLWQPMIAGVTTYEISSMPSPSDLNKAELAFFIDNVTNLKYGFTRNHLRVSVLSVQYEGLNNNFINIFKLCRSVYTTPKLDAEILEKSAKVFGQNSVGHKTVQMVCNSNIGVLVAPVDLSKLTGIDRFYPTSHLTEKNFSLRVENFNTEIGKINTKYADKIQDSDHQTVASCIVVLTQSEGIVLLFQKANLLSKEMIQDTISAFEKEFMPS